jgi:hypothetical protein
MKNRLIGIVAAICLSSLILAGCKWSPTPSQITLIAEESGLFASVGWIAIDNPSNEVKQIVSTILDVVNEKASMVETGSTYSVVIYPELVKVIDSQVKEQYRPLCKAASITLLGQLDLLFVIHPEWKKDQDVALNVVKSFITGAKNGLALTDNDPINIQAKQNLTHQNLVKDIK